MPKEPTCEICGKPAAGVASSRMGAISHAYCLDCLHNDREVWSTLVGGLFGLSPDTVADWVKPIIESTCKFYGRTEEDLWSEIRRLEEDYDAYCKAEAGKLSEAAE